MLRQNAIPVVLVAVAWLASLGTLLSETPNAGCNNFIHIGGEPCPTPSHILPIGTMCESLPVTDCNSTVLVETFDDTLNMREDLNAYHHYAPTGDTVPCYKYLTCIYNASLDMCVPFNHGTAPQLEMRAKPCENPTGPQ